MSEPYPFQELADYLRTRFPDVEKASTPMPQWRGETMLLAYERDAQIPFFYLSPPRRYTTTAGYTATGWEKDSAPHMGFNHFRDAPLSLIEWPDLWLRLIEAVANRHGYFGTEAPSVGMRRALAVAAAKDIEATTVSVLTPERVTVPWSV